MEFKINFNFERIFLSLFATIAAIAITGLIVSLLAALIAKFGAVSVLIIGGIGVLWFIIDRILFKLKAYPSQY